MSVRLLAASDRRCRRTSSAFADVLTSRCGPGRIRTSALVALDLRGAVVSLYLNEFVLLVQALPKVSALHALALTRMNHHSR